MNKNRVLIAGALALAVYGCGGGGGNPGSNGSGDPLSQGRSSLNKLVTGQQPTDAQTLQNALNLFQQAIQQNPGSPEAHFGTAICLAGLVTQQVNVGSGSTGSGAAGAGVSSGASGSGQSSSANGEALPPAPPGFQGSDPPSPPPQKLGLFWNLGLGVSSPFTLLETLLPVADIRYGLMPYYGYPNDDVTARQKMLSDLNTVEQNLQQVEANPNFSMTIPDPSGSGQQVTVGLPEVYLFDAYVNSLRAEIALSLAYVRDINGGEPPQPPSNGGAVGTGSGGSGSAGTGSTTGGVTVPPLLAYEPPPPTDVDKDGKLSPNEYLPPSPFLTLRDPSLLKTAQQALQAVASDETKGITGVFARPSDGSGGFLIPNSPDIHQALANIQTNVVPVIQQSATGPVTIQVPQIPELVTNQPFAAGPGQAVPMARAAAKRSRDVVFNVAMPAPAPGGLPIPSPPTLISVTIDLAAWFANPPADLKAFAPTYPLDSNGYPIYSQAVYPDPTFGGLFPNGLPQNLLF